MALDLEPADSLFGSRQSRKRFLHSQGWNVGCQAFCRVAAYAKPHDLRAPAPQITNHLARGIGREDGLRVMPACDWSGKAP